MTAANPDEQEQVLVNREGMVITDGCHTDESGFGGCSAQQVAVLMDGQCFSQKYGKYILLSAKDTY